MNRLALATALLTTLGTAYAQTAPFDPATRGHASDWRIGVVIDTVTESNANGGTTSLILDKPHGTIDTFGGPVPLETFEDVGHPSEVPVFNTNVIQPLFAALGLQSFDLHLASMTSGNSLMPIYWVGNHFELRVDNIQSWMTLFYTRKNTNAGQILGYYPAQFMMPSPMQGNVLFQQGTIDFDSNSGNTPPINLPATPQILALDMHMGTMEDTGGAFQSGVIETTNALWFTLTPASALSIKNTIMNSGMTSQWSLGQNMLDRQPEITGATIFKVTWLPNQAPILTVEDDYISLGLDQNANIDALAVGNTSAPPTGDYLKPDGNYYVFSLDGSLYAPSQFMCIATVDGTREKSALHDPNGVTLDATLGIGSDDIGGLCADDPETATQLSNSRILPVWYNDHTVRKLGFSASRLVTVPGAPFLGGVSGWASPTPIAQNREVYLQIRNWPNGGTIGNLYLGTRLAYKDGFGFAFPTNLVPAGSYECRVVQKLEGKVKEVSFWGSIRF
ncbi:MAG: hypothetical protein KDC95_09735 [Planctomycetes bacterium]|nr:hypothetical protein [Planctomycetota bacterium]